MPLVVGGVINTGDISGAIDLQSNINGDLGVRSRGVLGGLINTGYIGGGINLKSSAEGGGNAEGGGGKAEGGGNGTSSTGKLNSELLLTSINPLSLQFNCSYELLLNFYFRICSVWPHSGRNYFYNRNCPNNCVYNRILDSEYEMRSKVCVLRVITSDKRV